MRNIKIVFVFLLLASGAQAQNIARRQTVGAPGRYQVTNISGQNLFAHNLSWTVTGSVTACTITMNQSANNPQNWQTLGPLKDCTTAGYTPIINASTGYVSVQVVTFTGSGKVNFIYQGFQADPQELQIAVGTVKYFPGVPSGPCYANQQAMNSSNGVEYNCPNTLPGVAGTWVALPGGGGGGIAIGDPISGGTPNDILYVGAGPVIAQSTALPAGTTLDGDAIQTDTNTNALPSCASDCTLVNNNSLTPPTALKAYATAPSLVRTCEIVVGDPGAGSAALANDNDTPDVCANDTGATLTITAVHCFADAGSPTVTPIITGGGATSILTGALTCDQTQGGAAGTLNGTPTETNGQTIDGNITAAGGTAKYLVIRITRTLPAAS